MNILKKGRAVLSLLLILCLTALVLTGCGDSDTQKPAPETETTTQAQKVELTTKAEDYSSKKPITGGFFAERAFVNGFGVENVLEEGDPFVSYYAVNFGQNDLCQFMESKTNQEAKEMFATIYNGIEKDDESVSDSYDIDKGNFHKYVEIREGRYYAIVLLDNTLLFVNSNLEEQARYEVFMADINY